jgi:hypothetical protein
LHWNGDSFKKSGESMTKKVRGRFYFKRTKNNNLVGEWSNNDVVAGGVFTESCDKAGGDKAEEGEYIGIYYSTCTPLGKKISKPVLRN